MTFTIEVNNTEVLAAFNRLIQTGQDMSPILRSLGEDITLRAKQRFETSTAPDGTPWAPNSDTVLRALLHGNANNFTKKGAVSARGGRALAGKKPLIGDSKDLSTQIFPSVSGDTLTVTASPVYAAMQQFGGTKAEFPNLWGDIPARPFLPVTAAGELYPDEEREILDVLGKALENAVKG
jgi:phage gpG-like protein